MRRLLLIPHIKIQNANALSSPYTIGFPAMTAWLGAVHALQRHLNKSNWPTMQFIKAGISCHAINLQTYKGQGDYVYSIIGTANPVDKNGKRPAFIEEARCHLDVSLLINFQDYENDFNPNLNAQLQSDVATILTSKMKIASGDILTFGQPKIISIDENNPDEFKKYVLSKLMLGHVLIERRDLMERGMQEKNKDALTTLLDHLKIMHRSTLDDDSKATWTSKRKEAGWIVPIAVGYQGLSELSIAKNQRDLTTPHRFAESVITLGEFVMPYRIKKLDDMLWQYQVNLECNTYLCCNQTDF